MAGRIEVAGARHTVHCMSKTEMAGKVETDLRTNTKFGIKVDRAFHKFLMRQTSGTLYGIMTALYAGNLHPVLKSYLDGVQFSLHLANPDIPKRF